RTLSSLALPCEDTPQGLQLSNRVNRARQADACRFDLQGHFRFSIPATQLQWALLVVCQNRQIHIAQKTFGAAMETSPFDWPSSKKASL
ncbi:MAG: hypothetical protein WA851_01010, partial [Xanthobacteraceae bacterium]